MNSFIGHKFVFGFPDSITGQFTKAPVDEVLSIRYDCDHVLQIFHRLESPWSIPPTYDQSSDLLVSILYIYILTQITTT